LTSLINKTDGRYVPRGTCLIVNHNWRLKITMELRGKWADLLSELEQFGEDNDRRHHDRPHRSSTLPATQANFSLFWFELWVLGAC
jgi:hypothetical protein